MNDVTDASNFPKASFTLADQSGDNARNWEAVWIMLTGSPPTDLSLSFGIICTVRVFREECHSLEAASKAAFTELFTWELTLQCAAAYNRSQNR